MPRKLVIATVLLALLVGVAAVACKRTAPCPSGHVPSTSPCKLTGRTRTGALGIRFLEVSPGAYPLPVVKVRCEEFFGPEPVLIGFAGEGESGLRQWSTWSTPPLGVCWTESSRPLWITPSPVTVGQYLEFSTLGFEEVAPDRLDDPAHSTFWCVRDLGQTPEDYIRWLNSLDRTGRYDLPTPDECARAMVAGVRVRVLEYRLLTDPFHLTWTRIE